MKPNRFFLLFLTFLLLAPSLASAFEDEPAAREIMRKVRDRNDGDNAVMEQEMILIDKKGNERVRKIKSYAKDFGQDTYSILFFEEPADVRDTSFLTYDYFEDDKADDQWLYLPALKKVKRIANKDKDGSFMGSDFSYGDMTKRELSKFRYHLKKELDINGVKHWLIEIEPISDDVVDEYGYTYGEIAVRQDNLLVTLGKFNWDKGNKTKFLQVHEIKQIDGVWTPTLTTMTTKKGNRVHHKTVLKTLSVRYGQDLDENMFTTHRMEQGL